MSVYTEVNEAVWAARNQHRSRGLELLILMDSHTFHAYLNDAPAGVVWELVPPPHLTIQGYRVIRADIKGYMICRGA